MKLNDLTDELKAQVLAATTAEELMEIANENGLELEDEQIEAISGGDWNDPCDDYDSW